MQRIVDKIKIEFMEAATEFLYSLPEKAQKKITYNLLKIESGLIDSSIFKKLEGYDIWEFRTLFNGICYRLFAFWDKEEGALIIATHGMIKKTQKTPQKEIERAVTLMAEYYSNKGK